MLDQLDDRGGVRAITDFTATLHDPAFAAILAFFACVVALIAIAIIDEWGKK